MPHYNYQCRECNHEFEAFHKMSAQPLINCPKCCLPKLIKLISTGSAAIIKNTETPCHSSRNIRCKSNLGDKLGEGKNEMIETPWWRKGRLLDKTVLNDPNKYIYTGKTT